MHERLQYVYFPVFINILRFAQSDTSLFGYLPFRVNFPTNR